MSKLTLVTPPAAEPITRDEAKLWLKLEIDADDSIVDMLITAVREACEKELSQSFIRTVWRASLDGFPYGGGYYNREVRAMGWGPLSLPTMGGAEIQLDRPPLIEVLDLKYVDSAGTLQTIDPSLYRVSTGTPGRIQAVIGRSFPTPAQVIDAVQITYASGYGTTAASVPASIKLAMRLLLHHYFDDRQAIGTVPPGIAAALSPTDGGHYA